MTDCTILLAEDDADDREFFMEALEGVEASCAVDTVTNGRDVFRYLEQNGKPNVIVLDLNMPYLSGFEVLSRLKSHSTYSKIPVFVLTTSNSPYDAEKCYSLGCEEFYSKPASITEYQKIIKDIVLTP